MYTHKQILNPDDFFTELQKRREKGVYFYRICGYSDEIHTFIKKYYDAARRTGVIIEGKIPNPDEGNLSYYQEVMGREFRMDPVFLNEGLRRWLPRMTEFQRQNVVSALYDSLDGMRRAGKNENMLKNAFIKFMCWLYYKFERVVTQLGENHIPKILYEGTISHYELMLISILSNAGCDVVLLQYEGDTEYRKLDPDSRMSLLMERPGMTKFPAGYSLKKVRADIQEAYNRERMYGEPSKYAPCTNAWIEGNGLADILTPLKTRGEDPRFFYNAFYRMNGVSDRLTYTNELIRLRQGLKAAGRKTVVISGQIPMPSPEEISGIHRSQYANQDQMIQGLAANLQGRQSGELLKLARRAFIEAVLAEAEKTDHNLNRLTNKAVYLLCWYLRYAEALLGQWKMPEIGCFIYLGGCRNENEAMFLGFLSRLPVDVLILCPDLNKTCCLQDKRLYELTESESLALSRFPEENSQVSIGTAAYHAERDLDRIMYQDTGIYRNQQYAKAGVITLKTMYEEIRILWDEELKYRPNFSTADGKANIPVIFAKVNGVKDGNVNAYWMSVRELITEDTFVISSAPYLASNLANPMKMYAPEFYKNGKLLKEKIKNHPRYPYGILREDMQDFMLDKLQVLIDQKLIRGIGTNGTEYTAIAQVLNLPKEIVRMIQKFDFTKKNPKLIYINTGETMISLEDTILTAFLNLIGFDVLFFVPTGYQTVERMFAKTPMEEHQIGEYLYDLQVPDLNSISLKSRGTWRDRIFGR
ncbi:MAG: YceG family protein [Lachnospiraceae bacterium]|nr:YceG family protein [Lachnospiraceae bacterium]